MKLMQRQACLRLNNTQTNHWQCKNGTLITETKTLISNTCINVTIFVSLLLLDKERWIIPLQSWNLICSTEQHQKNRHVFQTKIFPGSICLAFPLDTLQERKLRRKLQSRSILQRESDTEEDSSYFFFFAFDFVALQIISFIRSQANLGGEQAVQRISDFGCTTLVPSEKPGLTPNSGQRWTETHFLFSVIHVL